MIIIKQMNPIMLYILGLISGLILSSVRQLQVQNGDIVSKEMEIKSIIQDFKNISFTGIGNRIYEEIFEYVEKIKL